MLLIKINEAIFIGGHEVIINECAVDMDPFELHTALKLAFNHLKDKHLTYAMSGGPNLLYKRAEHVSFFSYDEYIEICKEIEIQEATEGAKLYHTRMRRSEYSAVRPQLILAMIEAGIPYACSDEDCDEVTNLTIDHIIPLSRGGSDEIDNLRFMCRSHNSEKRDKIISEPSSK